MKKNMTLLLVCASLIALLSGGCANKEAVKGEQAVVPQPQAAKVEAAKPAVIAPVQQAQPVEQPTIVAAQPDLQSAKVSAATAAFETVYFDFDKSDLRQDARDALTRNAGIMLKSMAGVKIQVEGHCDERGSAEYNLALGERRAKSALQYLTTAGVQSGRLSIISYGKEKPAVQGSDESAWAKNRRAEFVVVK